MHTYNTYTHSHTYMHMHIHTYIHTYMHMHMHIHAHAHTYIHTYTHTYMHMRIHTWWLTTCFRGKVAIPAQAQLYYIYTTSTETTCGLYCNNLWAYINYIITIICDIELAKQPMVSQTVFISPHFPNMNWVNPRHMVFRQLPKVPHNSVVVMMKCHRLGFESRSLRWISC